MRLVYELHIEPTNYTSKPTDTGRINNAITQGTVSVTPEQLSERVAQGQTVVLATMNGKRSKLNMISQQVVMLDFDNTVDKQKAEGLFYRSLEDILNDEFIKENASFAYKTFSHKEDWNKFRVVFFLSQPLTNNDQVTALYNSLFKKFPTADIACKDSSRVFYGGTESIEVNYSNILQVSQEVLSSVPAVKVKRSQTPVIPVPKPAKVEVAKGDLKTWQLIRAGRKDEVRERLKGYGVRVHSKVQAINVFKSFNMMEFLGEPHNPCFDFFHYEKSPSAGMFQMENSDIWLYKCHSTTHEFTGDIVRVTTKLLGCGYMEAVNYLMDVTNTEIVLTEKIQAIREQCDAFTNLLLSDDLKSVYPEIHNRFWRYKTDVVTLLSLFKENIYEDEEGTLRSLSWYSIETLALKIYGKTSSMKTLERLINLLCFTSWIDKLDDSEIPAELLEKLKKSQNANKRSKRGNVFELLLLEDDFFEQLEEQCLEMKKNGFTMKGFSKEYLSRTHGKEIADNVFVQQKDVEISPIAQEMVEDIHKLTLTLIEKNGYATEKQVLALLQKKWKKRTLTEYKFKQAISEMLDLYNLERVTLTTALKEKFGLDTKSKGFPKVLVKAN